MSTDLGNGLACKALDVGYGKRIVCKDVELNVEPGKILTLIGPNGSGKSTILKSITRQLKLISGTIFLNSIDMNTMHGTDIAKCVSMVMTERPTPELMSCREVVSTGRYPYVGRLGILSKEDWQKVDAAMEMVHASEVAHLSFNEISDGQRQRVMLARALCQEPDILVLDEPTSFLDMRYKLDILSSIRNLATEKNIAVILSLHELELAMKISDSIACVDGEKISKLGSPEEIFEGDTIQKLYHVERKSFNPLTGVMHMSGSAGDPKVFVIGGGGAGIPIFYRLSRENVPFAVGVLMENDLEMDVAVASATEVVFSKAFEPIGSCEIERAKSLIDSCEQCICAVKEFGSLNKANEELLEYAKFKGKLV